MTSLSSRAHRLHPGHPGGRPLGERLHRLGGHASSTSSGTPRGSSGWCGSTTTRRSPTAAGAREAAKGWWPISFPRSSRRPRAVGGRRRRRRRLAAQPDQGRARPEEGGFPRGLLHRHEALPRPRVSTCASTGTTTTPTTPSGSTSTSRSTRCRRGAEAPGPEHAFVSELLGAPERAAAQGRAPRGRVHP